MMDYEEFSKINISLTFRRTILELYFCVISRRKSIRLSLLHFRSLKTGQNVIIVLES
jgi:uncharacterized protein involved in tellurium resistance